MNFEGCLQSNSAVHVAHYVANVQLPWRWVVGTGGSSSRMGGQTSSCEAVGVSTS